MKSEKGFTLIELLTVIGTIGVLAYLGLTAFKLYRSKGFYSSATITLHNAQNALEAAIVDQDHPPAALPLTVADGQGAIVDPAMAAILPGMKLSSHMELSAFYDPDCLDASCIASILQASPCLGEEHVRSVRSGDGLEVLLEHVAGNGC